jgi:hypothetical protein
MRPKTASRKSWLAFFLSLSAFSQSMPEVDQFREGCCVNPSFSRPTIVSQATVADKMLLKALNCATSSRFVGDAAQLARRFETGQSLLVAYYYGKYMPEQMGPALTIATYSRDGQSAMLLDIDVAKDTYSVTNVPFAKKSRSSWKLAEVSGGLWTYTRLFYLAQELGLRRRRSIAIQAINHEKPTECRVMFESTR